MWIVKTNCFLNFSIQYSYLSCITTGKNIKLLKLELASDNYSARWIILLGSLKASLTHAIHAATWLSCFFSSRRTKVEFTAQRKCISCSRSKVGGSTALLWRYPQVTVEQTVKTGNSMSCERNRNPLMESGRNHGETRANGWAFMQWNVLLCCALLSCFSPCHQNLRWFQTDSLSSNQY